MTSDLRNETESKFLASLLFKRSIKDQANNEEKQGVWEEIFVIIFANSDSDALLKANGYGSSKSGRSYISESGLVNWDFVSVERICQVDDGELYNGQELFSRYLRASEGESLLTPFDD